MSDHLAGDKAARRKRGIRTKGWRRSLHLIRGRVTHGWQWEIQMGHVCGAKFKMLPLFLFLSWVLPATSSVTYDHKAIIINGQRRILFSGSIHYPRSTPQVLLHIRSQFSGSHFLRSRRPVPSMNMEVKCLVVEWLFSR